MDRIYVPSDLESCAGICEIVIREYISTRYYILWIKKTKLWRTKEVTIENKKSIDGKTKIIAAGLNKAP